MPPTLLCFLAAGTDKVTYFESSKEDALKSARSYALADVSTFGYSAFGVDRFETLFVSVILWQAARKQVVAGVVPREESRRISRGVPPPTTISLSAFETCVLPQTLSAPHCAWCGIQVKAVSCWKYLQQRVVSWKLL
jgi:hypothetical protein